MFLSQRHCDGIRLAGLALMPTALDSIHTGVPVHTLNGPSINGWVFLENTLYVDEVGNFRVQKLTLH